MATKIRLKRLGGKHDPHFRIVIADARKRRDGSAVEELGYYSPIGEESTLKVDAERVQHWLSLGAQPTDTVRSLLVKAGVIEGPGGDDVADVAEAADEAVAEEAEEVAEDSEEIAEADEAGEPADEAPATE